MKLTLKARAIITLVIGAAALTPLAVQAAEAGPGPSNAGIENSADRSLAAFEGKTLDLSKSWGDATACWVDEAGNATCFRTEAAMDRAIERAGKTVEPPGASAAHGARAATCSSYMRLYSGSYYGGNALYLAQRGQWVNMWWYGFDNIVSSYKIGACNSIFRSGSSGTGTTYWGGTNAWTWKTTMTGWNNVLSSIYMY